MLFAGLRLRDLRTRAKRVETDPDGDGDGDGVAPCNRWNSSAPGGKASTMCTGRAGRAGRASDASRGKVGRSLSLGCVFNAWHTPGTRGRKGESKGMQCRLLSAVSLHIRDIRVLVL